MKSEPFRLFILVAGSIVTMASMAVAIITLFVTGHWIVALAILIPLLGILFGLIAIQEEYSIIEKWVKNGRVTQ